jgi:acyl carrier protein
MSADIFEKLNEVFENVFGEEIEVSAETVAADVDGWDSLHHVQLVMAVEKAFKIRFSGAEIASLKNVGHMVELIQQKLKR